MQSENPSKLLVVEGYDDQHVVGHLVEKHNTNLNFKIKNVDGYPNLLKSISPEIKAPGRERLGFLLDADQNSSAHWARVKKELKQAGVTPPDKLDQNGCIFVGDLTIGVWIMPDNRSVGELENFFLKMIPAQDPVWPLASQYIDAIPSTHRKFQNEKTDKAKLYAWLSSRKKPGKMGAAIGAGDLNLSNQLSMNFLKWLNNLFG